MIYKVTGTNRDTGARMALEFDASSKAAAERKASQAGMEVLHAEPIGSNGDSLTKPERVSHRGEDAGRGSVGKLVAIILIAATAIAVVVMWTNIRAMFGR